jgi:membrane protease subunit HflK
MNQQTPPPEIQQLLALFDKMKGSLSVIVPIFLIFVGVSGSYYTVQPDEEAVVIRLGKHLKNTNPGLHFKFPFGIDDVTKVKTKIVHQAEFGFRSLNTSSKRTTYSNRNFDTESLMLTGDLNVAEVQWVVQYQISNPFKYLFQMSEPETNIRDVAESIMRRVVGDKLVTEVLTTGRVEIATDAKLLMQVVLDKYDMGVSIKSIKLQDVNPPQVVKASFNEVNAAKQEQEKMINESEQAYNKVIPEARGKAKKLVTEAEGFASAIINRAHGDADKFLAQVREYRKAPAITRKRIYLDTMEEIFSRFDNLTIVDAKVKGLLPVYSKGVVK